MTASSANDDYTYRNQVNVAIDQLRLALETKDTGERIRLLNGALNNTGNAIGQLALFESNGSRRPERRYPGFRNQYDGLELLHLRVDENRVLCTDFDQYHCVINRCPCAPLDAGTWPPEEYDRWLDEHWDDPAERKRLQYRENAIVDPAHLPDRWIQACVWTITPHDVVDIRPA